MKRLLTIVILIGVIAYITVQFLKDRRFNPPSDYDYVVSEKIDKDYYDPAVLSQYYGLTLEIGTYARSLWNNDRIDVRFLDRENHESLEAVRYYNSLIVTAKMLEAQLEKSTDLKAQGYDNAEIELLLEKGVTPEDLRLRAISHLLNLTIGENGQRTLELQRILNSRGDSIPEDGLFNIITYNRLRAFQTENNLYPSGMVDENTLKALLK